MVPGLFVNSEFCFVYWGMNSRFVTIGFDSQAGRAPANYVKAIKLLRSFVESGGLLEARNLVLKPAPFVRLSPGVATDKLFRDLDNLGLHPKYLTEEELSVCEVHNS